MKLVRLSTKYSKNEKRNTNPILKDLEKAKELYDARRPEYLALADIVIDVTNKTAPECAKELLKKVKKYG